MNLDRNALAWGLFAAATAALIALLLATPTLNLDDLRIATEAPGAMKADWLGALKTVALNLDLGVAELRSYGLARTIQYAHVAIFGTGAFAAYAFIALAHVLSGVIVYRLFVRCHSDRTTALFVAVAWIASPAVMPLLKVQHQYLYLIAPYTALFAWLLGWGIAADRELNPVVGALVLIAAWGLGEGVIVPIAVAVVGSMRTKQRRQAVSLLAQGVVAGSLLLAYLWFQYRFVRDLNLPQRFHLSPDPTLIGAFLQQLVQSGRAILGLAHVDPELGMTLGGVGVSGDPLFWMALVLLAPAAAFCVRAPVAAPIDGLSRRALVLVAVWVASLAVYLLFALGGLGVFAVRYAAAFYALAPVALVALGMAARRPAVARLTAAVMATLSLALSIGLLHRAEVAVNRPNRALLASISHKAVVLRPDVPADRNPAMFGALPGIVPIGANGLNNPLRALWTTELVLRQSADATLGTECAWRGDDRAEISILGQPRGVFPIARFVVVGSALTPSEACRH